MLRKTEEPIRRALQVTGSTATREQEIEALAAQTQAWAAAKEQEIAALAKATHEWAAFREQEIEARATATQAWAAAREREIEAKARATEEWAAAREREIAAKAAQTQAWAAAKEQEIEAKAAQMEAWVAAREQEIEAQANATQEWAAAREHEMAAKANATQTWATAREQEMAAKANATQTWATAREQEIEATVQATQEWVAAKEQEIAAEAKATQEWAAAEEQEIEAKAAQTEAWVAAREQEIAAKHEWAERREDAVRRLSDNLTPAPFDDTRRFVAAISKRPHAGAKIFCIGMGKTGTTSLEAFFKGLGFTLGDQTTGALLVRDWARRNFDPIIALARSAQVFQDIPFSLPFTYSVLDREFPGAKFILSVRRDADEWYGSLTRFTTNVVGKNRLPTGDDLKNCPQPYRGWMFEAGSLISGVSEQEPLEKSKLVRVYEGHNAAVAEYFRHRPESLLTVNVADTDAAERIMTFVGMPYDGRPMPHLNRTK